MLQPRPHHRCGGVGVAGAQQLAETLGIGDGGEVARVGALERVLQITGRVGRVLPRGHRVPEDLAAVLQRPVPGFDDATRLDAPQDFKQLRRRDASHRRLTDPREHIGLEAGDDLVGIARGPAAALDGKPLECGRFERVERRQTLLAAHLDRACLNVGGLLGLPLLAGVETLGDQLTSRLGLASGRRQRSVRVRAQRQHLALALDAVVEAPAVRAAFDEQQQKQSVAVTQTLARVTLLDRLDGGVGGDEVASHGATPAFGARRWASYCQSYSTEGKNSRDFMKPIET